uniref:Uncharacterized protein n=1 Tax=Knipowitschia caucasica TaxID=637954 RepID=A0AAV2KD17_KNICA
MERQELLIEVKKNNNTRVIQEKMAKTFSIRRLEIVSESPAVEDFRDRWPALFCEDGIKEEFRRITTLSLEQSFMYKLDHYTPKLITLMKAKGGVLGTALRPFLYRLSQNQSIEERRDTIIRSLIVYLGEKVEDLFEDCQEDCRSEARKHILYRNDMLSGIVCRFGLCVAAAVFNSVCCRGYASPGFGTNFLEVFGSRLENNTNISVSEGLGVLPDTVGEDMC